MRRRTHVACALLVASALGGCTIGEGSDGDGDGKLSVYMSVPTRGPVGVHGRAISEGGALALRELGPVGGRGPSLHVRDDTRGGRWSPAAVGETARRATSDSAAIAYIGELESGATRVSLPITNEARLVQVSPASTALDLVTPGPGSDEVPELVQPSGERTFGRVIPDDEAQAGAGAAWARQMGARAALVISDGSDFGDSVADEFEEEAGALGIGLEAGDEPARPSGARAQVSAARPDLVYYAGASDRALPVLQRAAAAAPGAMIMGTDALLLDRSFLRRARPFESALRLTASAQDPSQLPHPLGQRFVRRYRERYRREPDPYAAYGYEAIALVLDLIDRAGGEAGDRTAIVDELFATSDRNSVLGTYSVDEVGDTTLDRIAGYRIRDARPVFDAALRVP
jgi:branched-chain amino acid transport system substrate-binding protein